MYVIA